MIIDLYSAQFYTLDAKKRMIFKVYRANCYVDGPVVMHYFFNVCNAGLFHT